MYTKRSGHLIIVLVVLMWPLLATDCHRKLTQQDRNKFLGRYDYLAIDSSSHDTLNIIPHPGTELDVMVIGLPSPFDSLAGKFDYPSGNLMFLTCKKSWANDTTFSASMALTNDDGSEMILRGQLIKDTSYAQDVFYGNAKK